MPSTSKKILEQLGNGNVTDKPEILFQRLDLEEVMKKVAELHPPVEEEKEEEAVIDIEAKPEITFDDFGAMQFQVGEIIACEEVKKSRKLLCSQVKIGSEVKQIVSGIKGHYSAEEMVGKKVMVLVNLKPAKLAGVLSEGMLLCAEDAEGNLALMVPEKEMLRFTGKPQALMSYTTSCKYYGTGSGWNMFTVITDDPVESGVYCQWKHFEKKDSLTRMVAPLAQNSFDFQHITLADGDGTASALLLSGGMLYQSPRAGKIYEPAADLEGEVNITLASKISNNALLYDEAGHRFAFYYNTSDGLGVKEIRSLVF